MEISFSKCGSVEIVFLGRNSRRKDVCACVYRGMILIDSMVVLPIVARASPLPVSVYIYVIFRKRKVASMRTKPIDDAMVPVLKN
jgi:hypothetical protein